MHFSTVPVLKNEEIARQTYKLTIQKDDHTVWKAGNFIMTLPEPQPEFFCWRRAFSIYDQTESTLVLLIKNVGRITNLLHSTKTGNIISYLGPLGNSFTIPDIESGELILIAGGIGIAPLHFFARILRENKRSFTLLYGASTSDDLIDISHLQDNNTLLYHATEDGTKGFHGRVTELLADYLSTSSGTKNMYACGPFAMLKTLAQLCKNRNDHSEISVETMMACGFGVCRGCAVPVRNNTYQTACKDGPVFNIKDIEWEKWL